MKSPNGAVTIKDVAARAGLTPAAVSMILNGKGTFKEETIMKVKRIVRELNYVPNVNATRLVKRETKLIGLLVPSMAEPFTIEVLRGIESQIRNSGYNLVIHSTVGRPKSEEEIYRDIARSRQVDGIVVQLFDHNQNRTQEFIQHKLPCVVIEADLKELDSISVNNYAGGFRATDYLARKGKKKILLVYGPLPSTVMSERRRGYEAALKKHNIRLSQKLLFEAPYKISEMRQQGSEVIESFARKSKELPFDAVFCAAGDEMAIGIVTALLELGYRIPKDVAVVGFDDQPIAQLISPHLTTIRQPIQKMGATAIDFLLHRIKHPDAPIQSRRLEPELIIRETA
ncbi:MAG: LacI family DNA-binding transcriptional regulator [Chloroherpetonaceae bacterium]|nr:LacI family DNA-binding transcriptional regulator [Chloroherpetonaceae bacterium]